MKFHAGDFSLKDKQCPGCMVEVVDDHIKVIIDAVHHNTICEIALKLNVSHTCIEKGLT